MVLSPVVLPLLLCVGQAVLKCFEGGGVTATTGEGMPTTSTAPDGTPTWLLAVVGLAVLAGASVALRGTAVVRR